MLKERGGGRSPEPLSFDFGERRTYAAFSFFFVFRLSIFIIISQFPWAMEDGQRTVYIAMDLHFNPNIMTTILVRRNL